MQNNRMTGSRGPQEMQVERRKGGPCLGQCGGLPPLGLEKWNSFFRLFFPAEAQPYFWFYKSELPRAKHLSSFILIVRVIILYTQIPEIIFLVGNQ